MKNFVQNGDTIVVAAPEAADSGEFLISGGIHGVAAAAADNAADVPLVRRGVFTLPKESGTAWSQGDRLFWNTSTKCFTKDVTDRPIAAVAAEAAASADTTGNVLLGGEGGLRYVGGQITNATASDTVVTGLATVVACGAGLDDNPGDDPMLANASKGDQAGTPAAGSILVKTWKNTGGTDPTPAAATTFSKKVNWWAIGI